MILAEESYRFYNQAEPDRRRLQEAGWRPEYGAVLGALRYCRPTAEGRALDFGCGVGDLVALLDRTGYAALGADISLPAVQSAVQRYPHLSFVALDSGPQLPFPSGHFSVVTAVNAIEFVVAPAATLQELARLLAPEGLLVMTFPNLLSPQRPMRRFLARRRRRKYGAESGDTSWESVELVARDLALLLTIRIRGEPRFWPREPDFANAERYRLLGYGPDYAASWLCNPLDVVLQLQQLGLTVEAVRKIPGAGERSLAMSRLRRLLPAGLASPVLLVAGRPR